MHARSWFRLREKVSLTWNQLRCSANYSSNLQTTTKKTDIFSKWVVRIVHAADSHHHNGHIIGIWRWLADASARHIARHSKRRRYWSSTDCIQSRMNRVSRALRSTLCPILLINIFCVYVVQPCTHTHDKLNDSNSPETIMCEQRVLRTRHIDGEWRVVRGHMHLHITYPCT